VTFEGLQLFREPRVTLRLPRRPARGFIKDEDSHPAATLERDGRASGPTSVRKMRNILHFVLQKPRSLNTHIPITPSNSEFGTRLKASIYQADLMLLPTSHMHDIECGLLLKASAVDFEYNGVQHQKGSLRVIKVEQDGVCKVWLSGTFQNVRCEHECGCRIDACGAFKCVCVSKIRVVQSKRR